MGLDECSYARYGRQMRAIEALMESLPPDWQPTRRSPHQPEPRPGDPTRPSIPSPRRPSHAFIEPLV